MTKLELNSYAFHRKFDGKLEKKAYEIAKAQYAEISVDVDAAIAKMKKVNIDLNIKKEYDFQRRYLENS